MNKHVTSRLLVSTCIVLALLLSGCETLIKTNLINAKSYPNNLGVTSQLMQEFKVSTKQHCDLKFGCYDYLFAPSQGHSKKFDMNIHAAFTNKEHSISLQLHREDIPEFTGSVLIMHGFRASKEWMLISAAYFQFLGFDVYMLDLLGHGSSNAAKGFGVKDAEYAQRFISDQLDQTKPILAVGNSMGGLVAATLAKNTVVDAAILQAPMTQFDESLLGYFKDTKPWYDFLFSDKQKLSAAESALKSAGLSQSQTNSLTLIQASDAPYLVFASNIDSVSPYAKLKTLQSARVTVIEIDQLEHAYMSMIGHQEHQHIMQWLGSINFIAKNNRQR